MSVLLLIAVFILLLATIFLAVGIYEKSTNAICLSKKRLDGRTVLVTGGTAGMGLEAATDFAQRGARVIVACPFQDEGTQAVRTIIQNSENESVVFKLLDLASFTSVRELAADILKNEDRLDLLVNNAGVGGPRNAVSQDGLNFVMQVNYYGAFLLTLLLLPLLKKSGRPGEPSRIVNLSSILHTIGRVNINNLDNNFFMIQVYGNSKLYVVMFSRELTKRLQNSNVVINNVDPGAVGTNIFLTANRYLGYFVTLLCLVIFKNPWQGAQTTIHAALDKKAGEVSGEFFKNCKQSRAISTAYNDKLAKMLFEESVRIVNLTNEELDLCFKRS